jgi:hypothetical protein
VLNLRMLLCNSKYALCLTKENLTMRSEHIVTCMGITLLIASLCQDVASVMCILGYAANNFWPSRMWRVFIYFAHTLIQSHFIIVPLAPSSAAVRLRVPSSMTVVPRLSDFFPWSRLLQDWLTSLAVTSRLTLQMQYLLISIQPLLINEPFVTTFSEETRLLSRLEVTFYQGTILRVRRSVAPETLFINHGDVFHLSRCYSTSRRCYGLSL